MTILEVTRAATDYFEKRGLESPRLNAEHLVAHVLGLKRLDLYLRFEESPNEDQLSVLRDLTRKRGQGVPLQHLLGTVEFCGRTYAVDSRALIPRPETEQLAELLLAHLSQSGRSAPERILDMGTGSAVLALTLGLARPDAKVLGVDISEAALSLARENHSRNGAPANVEFLVSDLCSNVEGSFEVVVANLPYIATTDLPTLQPEVLHDPVSALDGGTQGHELIEKFLRSLPPHLAPGAVIALEIGEDQGPTILSVLENENYRDTRLLPDYTGRTRFLFANYG